MAKPRVAYAVRNQVTMEVTTLDALIDRGHVVREIWAYVERLDLGELYDRIGSREGAAGPPCFDQRMLLCLWIYATGDGVGSARRLSQLLQEHVVCRWIAGGDVINHHTLSSFRSENEAVQDRLLTASVAAWAQDGLIGRDSMSVSQDGMRVRASAGRSSMRRRESLERRNCAVTMPDTIAKRKAPPTCAKDDRPLVDKWIARMTVADHKQANALRDSTVEWANAMARQQGLLQLNVCGAVKVRAVALLHALTHNIRRTLALVRANQEEQAA